MTCNQTQTQYRSVQNRTHCRKSTNMLRGADVGSVLRARALGPPAHRVVGIHVHVRSYASDHRHQGKIHVTCHQAELFTVQLF